jgi:hypothetical protein
MKPFIAAHVVQAAMRAFRRKTPVAESVKTAGPLYSCWPIA